MPGSFVSCDWGTTRLRLRVVETQDVAPLAEFSSLDGVARLASQFAPADRPSRYRAILAAGLHELSSRPGVNLGDAPVLVSGMASSSIGWQEVPYARLPMPLDGSQLTWRELEPISSDRGSRRVVLISGARSASDVMRGEETEMVGLFTLPVARRLAAGSLVIKPGTHSKQLRVEEGRIVGVQTFMTGELRDVLCRHSVLRHSLGAADPTAPPADDAAGDLQAGVRHGLALPLAAALFRVRTRQLLDNASDASNRAFLSGVLLGSELAYLRDPQFDDVPLLLCATSLFQAPYRAALAELELGARLTVVAADEVELLSARGQAVLGRRLGLF
jgi:2-dehydro-3-deoxygalactonokinase